MGQRLFRLVFLKKVVLLIVVLIVLWLVVCLVGGVPLRSTTRVFDCVWGWVWGCS